MQTKWTPNDLNDLTFLSIAVGYRDIVVTEKKWAAMFNRTPLPERFDTIMMSDLARPGDELIAASARYHVDR